MRHTRTAANDLYLSTTLMRRDADGDPVECDVLVNFEVLSFTRGYHATWDDPGCAAEYELGFISAELDGEPGDAPGPLTRIEIATLRDWFDDNHARAAQEANDNERGY